MGTPAIVSQVSSLPEVVGNAGLLVNPYNVDDIRRSIKMLLTDETLRKQFISKGLSQVKKYTWESTAKRVLEGLNNL